ncbi:MAG: hypothetical protein HKM95_03135 [Inquilinus sp.]|nr:hypothetical protein [Inquilinus sp.]
MIAAAVFATAIIIAKDFLHLLLTFSYGMLQLHDMLSIIGANILYIDEIGDGTE